MNGITITEHVSFILVFLEGMLSFLSPCVIPLLPVYMSYLSGSANTQTEGKIIYQRKRVFTHTVFFVLGISFAFLLLGTSFTLLGDLFSSNKYLFIRISGILIIVLGLFQLDIFHFSFLQKERKFHLPIIGRKINPLIAFILGFTFSFAWTPCIGPALSSVLILTSGAKTATAGYLLILVYAIGFIIPFLFLGLFTMELLNLFNKKRNLLRYTIKIGGVLLVVIGLMTFTGFMNGISSYLNKASVNSDASEADDKTKTIVSSIDFTLTDQYGNSHTLSDYQGKVVFLNFFATWCPPCNKELPDIEKLYQDYGYNNEDIVFLGITNPKSKEHPNNADEDVDYIKDFLKNKGYTFPTLFDETGALLEEYGVSAFPTTFLINKKGEIYGYVPGMMTEDIMKNVIKQTLEAEDSE